MGTDASFEDWYLREHPRLLATMTTAAGDRDLATDVTGEAFTRVLERWERVSAMDSPTGWAYQVAINVLRRRLRRAALERRLLFRHPPTAVVAPGDIGVELWAAVAGLPARMREAVALRYARDLTEEEVAAAMGVRPGTASATLHAARRRLAAALGEDVEEATRG